MATTNFSFTELNSTDNAGHTSINNVITSIDTILNASTRLLPAGLATTSGYTLVWSGGVLTTGQVDTAGIADGAVTAAKVAADVATQAELDAHAADTTSVHGITDTSALALKSGNTYTGTHNFSGATINVPTASPGDNDTSAASTAFVTNAVANASAGVGTVNYAALTNDVKTFDVPTSGTGVYFTTSGDFTSDSLSTASAQNPLVIANSSSAITLSLPNTIGTEGATITVAQIGIGAVTISPKSGAAATINGSTTDVYYPNEQYSIVTLVCLSNSGSNGTWIITGDYV